MNNEEKILLLLENMGKDVAELKQGYKSMGQDVAELKRNYEFIRQVVVRIENTHEERLDAMADGQKVQEEETVRLKLRVTKLEEAAKIRQVK